MSLTYLYKRGDTAPPITATLSDSAGPLVLTGHTVRFIMSPAASGALPTINALATIVNATAGQVRYVLQPTDLAVIGTYRVEWEDIDGAGLQRRIPTDDFDTLIVGPNAEDEIAGEAAPPAVPQRPIRVDFEMVKGNRKVLHFALPLRNENNVAIDASAYLQIWFYAKRSAGDVDPGLIAKTKGAGVGSATTILVNPVVAGVAQGLNTYDVYLLPTDTASLEPGYQTPLWVECRALVGTGDIRTIAVGWLVCQPGAVNAVS